MLKAREVVEEKGCRFCGEDFEVGELNERALRVVQRPI
jgi:hypothetical protein